MKLDLIKTKKLRAYSLLEVLISLIVISTAMISSVVVLTQSYSLVRENEVKSFADSITVRVFETMRSKEEIGIQGGVLETVGTSLNSSFIVKEDTTSNQLYLSTASTAFADDCLANPQSEYFYTSEELTDQDDTRYRACLNVAVVKVGSLYDITISVKYPFRGEVLTNVLKTSRSSGFYTKI